MFDHITLETFLKYVFLTFITYALTIFTLYHIAVVFVKDKLERWLFQYRLDFWGGLCYYVISVGFSCFYCQSFWISLIVSSFFDIGFWGWLVVWGMSCYLYNIVKEKDVSI